MVVGASGLGKTTFVRTLTQNTGFRFDQPLKPNIGPTLEIEVFQSEIELAQRKVLMTIIDTPGFGDRLDNSQVSQNVLQYVEKQFRDYLSGQLKINRNAKYLDPRVHASLYFLDPSAPFSLSEMDMEFMRTLGRSTNIIPVIGRADMLAEGELINYKKMILEQINANDLKIYNFPIFSDDEEAFMSTNNQLEDMLPFALVGSEEYHEVNGQKVCGRKYPWGIVEVENPQHCDFATFQDVLLNTHLEALKEDTHEIHYEYFRKTDLIRQETEKGGKEDGAIKHRDVLALKVAEEEEMKARKRRSRNLS